MKREVTFLLALAFLANSSSLALAQSDKVDDKDLEAIIEGDKAVEEPSSEVTEMENTEKSSTASSEPVDVEAVKEEIPPEELENLEAGQSKSNIEGEAAGDELDALKADLKDSTAAEESEEFKPATSDSSLETAEAKEAEEAAKKAAEAKKAEETKEIAQTNQKEPEVFDVGREERELLGMAQNIQGQISDTEWSEVATATKVDSYTVVRNDWLFKISKKLFGSGFYYPKIWSLNSYITNPHFIEPGMILSFTTGSGANAPQVKLGSFTESEINAIPGATGNFNADDLANFGDDAKPKWLDDKKDLQNQGVYFQYASEETMDDLTKMGEQALNREYENYQPPRNDFDVIVPGNYDSSGFDKNSRIIYSFKEGFFLSTFVSTNMVQDFGEITNGPDENIYFINHDKAYVKFDESVNALPGDKFSVYSSNGLAKNNNSDRQGYKYAIVGQIKLIRKIKDKWEVEFIEIAGTPQRGDRITTYTPKLDRITRSYNSRLIEAAILDTFNKGQMVLGFGDVIYLDRGRADGVEMGNVFDVYGFKDRALKENITDQPTYKMGEVTVITLTDNFATALVTKTVRDFYPGDIALTKTKEAHLRELRAYEADHQSKKELIGGKALEELDVELNMENLNDDLLKQADKIQLTEDELAELERQEREKSVIKDSEKDLKSLERLENEIEQAEKILNDAKIDEDKLLENENLNDIEKKQGNVDQESLDEIEENLGKRYVDEDLNSKDNPYGLTEFDVEEIDELLNSEKKENK